MDTNGEKRPQKLGRARIETWKESADLKLGYRRERLDVSFQDRCSTSRGSKFPPRFISFL